jgi:hypothetical protein
MRALAATGGHSFDLHNFPAFLTPHPVTLRWDEHPGGLADISSGKFGVSPH